MTPRWPILLLFLLSLPLASCAVGRGFQTAELLSNLASERLPDGVVRVEQPFSMEGRARQADLYHPTGWRPPAALVVVPGASPAGRDDPRLVAFAGTLAKAGFLVLVPEIPALRRLTLSAADAEIVADGLRHLEQARPGRFLAAVALSYAVGPTMLAAHAPDLAGKVDALVGIGGYYDSEAVSVWFTTGWFLVPEGEDGAPAQWRRGAPNDFGKWVFLRANAGRLEDGHDTALLEEMADRRLRDGRADLSDLEARLGPEGRSVHDFITNRDRDRAPALIAALPPAIRAEMRALDLSDRDFGPKGPHLVLIHGRGDTIIPYTESLALAGAVLGPDGRPRTELHLVDGIGHVEAGGITFGDALVLADAIYSLLSLRDRHR